MRLTEAMRRGAGGEEEEEGGPMRRERRGQDPVGGVTDAGGLLCHRDSGEGEEEEGWKVGVTLLWRKQHI